MANTKKGKKTNAIISNTLQIPDDMVYESALTYDLHRWESRLTSPIPAHDAIQQPFNATLHPVEWAVHEAIPYMVGLVGTNYCLCHNDNLGGCLQEVHCLPSSRYPLEADHLAPRLRLPQLTHQRLIAPVYLRHK